MNWIPFLSYVAVSTFTPGPNNISSMSNAGRYGFWRSMAYRLGIASGFFVIMLAAALFSAVLLEKIPPLKPWLLALGAAYILWLAWKTYSGGGSHGSSQSDCTFLSGLLLQLVNVKVILYGITIMSTFVLPHTSSLAVYAGVSAFLAAMAFVSTSSWALFGAAFSRFLSSHERLANTVMALLLVYCAVSLYL
ncbi:MAG: LysE family transporter [Pyramidobacter sp.]|nr:LysE family transporter [Pyramidobacter sp.]